MSPFCLLPNDFAVKIKDVIADHVGIEAQRVHAGLSRAFHSEKLYPEGALVPFIKVLYMYIFA